MLWWMARNRDRRRLHAGAACGGAALMPALITFSRDWADEFNVDGFKVVDTMSEAAEYKQHFAKPRTYYFGTNEGWEDEILDESIVVWEISDEEAATLCRLLGVAEHRVYGHMPVDWDEDDAWDDGSSYAP
ncbi:hypothetical protein MYRNA_19 [Mycobacterium phage Myrna]|uniref:Uncharacterized protein n=1 Tax=Mycobacterium phage Myrna TaxID=546805 RepID=B5LJ30_9CAUD|nr:gp19 [Mycobacterium phage Myrna]ACH62027.1 hypothetical protein MYRNA_19 [Mycobacterium phage Myrna]